MDIRKIYTGQLREVWPQVRKGLEELASKSKVDWIPEEIYHNLANEWATLYMVYETETGYQGFFILQSHDTVHGKACLIWIAYNEVNVHGVTIECAQEIEKFARSAGFDYLKFTSRRLGWLKHAKAYGFELDELIFIKRLK